MKKMFLILLMLVFFMSFPSTKTSSREEELRGVFVSYIEIEEYFKDKEENNSKKMVLSMIHQIKSIGCNTIILQVRPCSDAMYYSNIFPISTYLSSNGEYPYDFLEYFIEETHKENMKLIAWINPYRIQTISNKSLISENHPAYPYLDSDIVFEKDGLYYNPSRDEVLNLIVEGVKEVLDYSIDGLLFDDYFYPSSDIDLEEYHYYTKNMSISLEDYHLMIINQMIKKVHEECQKKKIRFGVSPEGNIENNYKNNYADVITWLKEKEYVDFIMPQIYYGFENGVKPFYDTSLEWIDLIKNDNIDYYVALAFYKVGKTDYYAKKGKDEWINHSDIIMREIIASRFFQHYKGFSLFRYDDLFDQNHFTNNSQEELNNLKKILK
ncbi:MAG: family 10 glycosylhydrolase [Bacilli bacterium]|nr:family 10 glycosylhydrolase [Bacilli bacterium]